MTADDLPGPDAARLSPDFATPRRRWPRFATGSRAIAGSRDRPSDRVGARPLGGHVTETLRLAGPISMAHFSNLATTTATLLMFGWTSADALAAGGLAIRAAVSTNILCGVVVIAGLMMSEAEGAGDGRAVAESYSRGLVLAGLLSILSFAWMSAAPSLLLALGQDPEIVAGTAAVLDIMRWAEPANLIRLGLMRAALPALGLASILFVLTPISIAVYVLLGFGLVSGHGGLPEVGWLGIPWAFVLVSWAGALVMLAVVHLGPRRRKVPFGIAGVKGLFHVFGRGLPIGMMQAIDNVYYLTLTLLIGQFGAATLAAHQIALNFGTIAWAFASAFGDAGALRIRYRRGARAMDDAWRAGNVASTLSILSMTAAALVVAAFPATFIGLFLDARLPENASTVAIATTLIPFAAGFIFADGLYGAGMGVLRGLDDNRFAMIASALGYWGVGMPLACLFAFWLGYGGVGIWMGIVCGVTLVGSVLLARFAWQSRHFEAAAPVAAAVLPGAGGGTS